MDMFDNLILGFTVALSLQNLVYCFGGVCVGTASGVLPGIGPLVTIAMLLPITFNLPPIPALIMLSGIYYGSQYGGSPPSLFFKPPGEGRARTGAGDRGGQLLFRRLRGHAADRDVRPADCGDGAQVRGAGILRADADGPGRRRLPL